VVSLILQVLVTMPPLSAISLKSALRRPQPQSSGLPSVQ
jgi:hypothetical protein